ncbi:MAG: UDP-N-acetylmuramoyl-L-alanyl-D-glutamate--2,6-diaminopimelate ligase [Bacteroidales bacterium]|jgi:UDP-N-acetylmuramoyl-L-alanyl-D-glutamate--2,6-diaminopimelate ligase|nr:UDP-N-acetylmuramoyl-L-alanyl-D-glutamate--2,6-diaminopimelate ligase [Bacteroidales bacterium]MDY0315393.1 UDP-N-acetylmuramoyl-L-alanyl-D-glutamate--2,6-diaminopimelate ligase [Bacteroidales bacterium]
MNIKDYISKIDTVESIFNNEGDFTKLEFDSKKVENKDVFIAIPGSQHDGHKFINNAIENGASIIICEKFPEKIDSKLTYIKVISSSKALGILASNFYGNPSKKIKLIGVTGTNGKTTIATSLFNLTKNLGYKVGLISTIQVIIDNKKIEATHTTPDQLRLNKYLSEMVDIGCDYCFMEVSSHAIVQNRIAGLEFVGGIFTNLTHEHLDFHKTFKEYLKAKQDFFTSLRPNAFAITNNDDKNGQIMLQNSKAKKISYAIKSVADYKAQILESHFNGMLLQIDNTEVWTNYIGKFNVSNILSIYATAIELGFKKDEILKGISALEPVVGRFETLYSKTGITAIIDYAHTPDALKNVLTTIKEINTAEGKIITVVGAGGNRDKTKRPEMAAIAAEYSDKLILTSDNPRFENAEEILKDMYQGINIIQEKKTLKIKDRKEAIKTAVFLANQGDIILVAGKGHENYQEIEGIKYHFDDKEVLSEIFNIL